MSPHEFDTTGPITHTSPVTSYPSLNIGEAYCYKCKWRGLLPAYDSHFCLQPITPLAQDLATIVTVICRDCNETYIPMGTGNDPMEHICLSKLANMTFKTKICPDFPLEDEQQEIRKLARQQSTTEELIDELKTRGYRKVTLER